MRKDGSCHRWWSCRKTTHLVSHFFYPLKIVSNQLFSKRCWKQRNCLVNKCSLPTGSFVNFEGVTSWPLIRQTPLASDKQLQIEISMRRTSPQSFIWIHLHPSSVNMSSTNPKTYTETVYTFLRNILGFTSSSLAESFSHWPRLKRRGNFWGTGHFFRNFLPRMIGSAGKSVSILPEKCVCVSSVFNIQSMIQLN